jgi:hypothetical protein
MYTKLESRYTGKAQVDIKTKQSSKRDSHLHIPTIKSLTIHDVHHSRQSWSVSIVDRYQVFIEAELQASGNLMFNRLLSVGHAA